MSLVQGNVQQSLKFDPAFRDRSDDLHLALAEQSRGRVVVLPESAFPVPADRLRPDVPRRLADIARSRGGDVLFGVFLIEPPAPGSDEPRIHNSVVSVGSARTQVYRKRHLVPFGETIPAKPVVGWFINRVLAIPLSDQTPGPADQPPFEVGGARIAVNICYEDAFGDELRAGAREATLLVNVTNDAWYGRSIAARQHNQIAAMRALELGRPMLRATNTGITSAIDHDGRVVAAAALVHRRHSRGRGDGTRRRDALPALRRCAAARRCGTGARCRGVRGRAARQRGRHAAKAAKISSF